MSNDGTLHSVIPGSTPAELHLVVRSDKSLAWYYRNAAGQLVQLDSSDTLIVEYPDDLAPATNVELRIVNVTTAPVDIEVVPHGRATASPNGSQSIADEYVWKCQHNGGEACTCAAPSTSCVCGSWSVKGGPKPGGVVIPDPTFKVRWQARTNEPSAT